MHWTDIPRNPSAKTLRQFAAAWLVFFLAFGAHQYVVRHHHLPGAVLGVMAVTLGLLGLIKPVAVRRLFIAWMVLAFPIGWLISQVMLLLMFYLLITPVALLFRLQGRDPLARKPAPERVSFWAPKKLPEDVRSYFRQY
jgi:hypothetical protein